MATIRKIANSKKGSYQIIVSNGYDSNNKQIRATATFTPDQTKSKRMQEKQLQAFAIEFERQVKTGKLYNGDKICFSDFVKEWREKEAELNLEATTLYSYDKHLKNVILPAIGKYKLSKITPIILEDFYRSLTKEDARTDGKGGYKVASIKKFHKIISGIMSTAVRWKVIEENPCDKVKMLKERREHGEVQYFTFEQAVKFLELLDKPYSVPYKGRKITAPNGQVIQLNTYIKERMMPIQFKIFYLLYLYTGARRGELIALTWEDIDFEERTMRIIKSAGHSEEGQIIKSTKTKSSERVLRIPSNVITLLRKWKIEQMTLMLTVGSEWVGYRTQEEFDKNSIFIQTHINYGKTMSISTPYRKFIEFITHYNQTVEREEDKLPLIHLHGLRHTCATLNIGNDVDLKTIQALLGHAQIQTTMNTYAHALEEKMRVSTDSLADYLTKQA